MPTKKKESLEKVPAEIAVSKKDAKKNPFCSELRLGDPEEMLKVLNELAHGYYMTSREHSREKTVERIWNGWKHLLSGTVYEPDPDWGTPEGDAREAKAFRLVSQRTESP